MMKYCYICKADMTEMH